MCGRYVLEDPAAINKLAKRTFGIEAPEFRPRFNVAPSQDLPIIALNGSAKPSFQTMRWGLVPFWDKSEKPKFAPINARSEEIIGKPMFRQSLQKRRCLVPADAFFEWKRITEAKKVPYCIGLVDRAPFFFAGIYEAATAIRPATYALLTTGPNELMKEIHDRMPVILDEGRSRAWIQPGEVTSETIAQTCVPFPAHLMRAYPVSPLVNNPRNDRPECVARANPPSD